MAKAKEGTVRGYFENWLRRQEPSVKENKLMVTWMRRAYHTGIGSCQKEIEELKKENEHLQAMYNIAFKKPGCRSTKSWLAEEEARIRREGR